MLYSTNLKAKEVNIKEAILKGLAEDKGLYMPKEIPKLTNEEIASLKDKAYYEIAFTILIKYLKGFIPDDKLLEICKSSYNFPVPIERLDDRLYILRLDQGPTAAFKDFAARAMARIMDYFLEQDNNELLILTATSGDTGSAVANAFFGMERIKVVVLFPKEEITERQRKLMTTLGGNITAISIDGKFDDCQALVKEAFVDPDLKYLNLSSANSINIARLLPQIVYYAYAYSRLGKVNFSIPSGNFGDLMGGLFAKEMGIPVNKFIVAVNENDEFVDFYNTGEYKNISPSKNSLSNAMNVGHPSNLARLIALYGGIIDEKGIIAKMPDMQKIRHDMVAVSVTDEQTKEEIRSIYKKFHVIIEPHGAVGLYAAEKNKDLRLVCLETADPAKFPDTVKEVIKIDPALPECLRQALKKEEYLKNLDNNYQDFKQFLIGNFK
ncbi:MAG: threonine synthase [Nanoarchaeota archaeon]|nr:threonine synthase [Nanoarchaeota archaeon]